MISEEERRVVIAALEEIRDRLKRRTVETACLGTLAVTVDDIDDVIAEAIASVEVG